MPGSKEVAKKEVPEVQEGVEEAESSNQKPKHRKTFKQKDEEATEVANAAKETDTSSSKELKSNKRGRNAKEKEEDEEGPPKKERKEKSADEKKRLSRKAVAYRKAYKAALDDESAKLAGRTVSCLNTFALAGTKNHAVCLDTSCLYLGLDMLFNMPNFMV